jgi:hypothetical protein
MDDFQWVLFGLVVAVTTQPRVAFNVARFWKRPNSPRVGASASGSEQAKVVA